MYHNNRMNPTKYPKKNNNIFQPNIKVYQSPNQQNQNLIYNNNAIKNYDIRVNKIKPAVKEKIIEGELNFNNNNKNIIHHNRIPNNVKQRKQRNKPTKSPVPLPKDYKPSNYQKLFNNHHIPNTNSLIKPKSAVPRKNNFISNNNNNALNKNILKPNTNHLGLSSNFTSNKTYNAFNIFKKQLDRKQSPFQRTSYSNNPGNNFIQKNQIKSRHTSKSTILSKNYGYNIWEKIERNEDYIKNQQKIKDLKIKIKEEENDIEKILENNKEEIKNYNEKIIKLQNDLLNTKQGDIFYLEEENKIAEIQIQNLSATYQRLVEENKKEKENIYYLLNEDIFKLTKELKKEIEEVKKIKHQIKNLSKKKPPNDIMKKIEVVMKYINKKNL